MSLSVVPPPAAAEDCLRSKEKGAGLREGGAGPGEPAQLLPSALTPFPEEASVDQSRTRAAHSRSLVDTGPMFCVFCDGINAIK